MVAALYAILLGGLLAAAAVILVMVREAFRIQIIAEEITLPGLPAAFDGFRLLFITDIHRRKLPAKSLAELKGSVDAVLLGGDLTERGNPLDRLIANVDLAAAVAPAYAVHGNHDYKANISLVDNVLRGRGIKLLCDENIILERADAKLVLTGVDFPRTGGVKAYGPVPDLPQELPCGLCRIILVHDPLWLSKQQEVPADLVLAGHTHGGQVVLPVIGRRLVAEFYRQYSAGTYFIPRNDGSGAEARLLISRGFGTAHLPLRLGSPAEMHVLTLRCAKERADK